MWRGWLLSTERGGSLRKGLTKDRHTALVTSAPASKITAAFLVEILWNLWSLYSRSGHKGRWRDGDG